jgi:hypothetical protein
MLRLTLKLHHSISGSDATRERITATREKITHGLPLVANPYHQIRLKGNDLFALRPWEHRRDYSERLAMMASPIVAFAEAFVDR